MKYKLLLTGRSVSIINDFFMQSTNTFDIMTTSLRHDDIMVHLKYYGPDAFCYCLNKESPDDVNRLVSLIPKLTERNVNFVIIGTSEDVDNFLKTSFESPDLVLKRPMTAEAMENRIEELLDNSKATAEKNKDRTDSIDALLSGIPTTTTVVRKRILVIDDDPLMLRMLKERLHTAYDVAVAPSGKVARKYLESRKPDLILLDYEMPEENGPQVLSSLRENPLTWDIPVVFLTGISGRGQIAEALALQPQGYLLKPVDQKKLMETIAGIFDENKDETDAEGALFK